MKDSYTKTTTQPAFAQEIGKKIKYPDKHNPGVKTVTSTALVLIFLFGARTDRGSRLRAHVRRDPHMHPIP